MKLTKPRYQVFVSSTFIDLREEREAVTMELLFNRYIPVGMEGFTATSDRGWKSIQRAIDTSDYYVIVVAGRYGTVDPEHDMSWTEREYRYAVQKGLKVLGFVRRDDAITKDKTEDCEEERRRLVAFTSEIKNNHLVMSWATSEDLKREVPKALMGQINQDEDEDELPSGWYRGDQMASGSALEEISRLSRENADLRDRVAKLDAKSEELVLQFSDGTLVEDRTVSATELVLAEASPGSLNSFPAISDEALGEYLLTKSRAHFLKLKVANMGAAPANNVVVELTIRRAAQIHLNWLEEPKSPMAGLISRPVTPWYLDPNESTYIDSWSLLDGRGEVLQRVRQVGASGDEGLVQIVVESTADEYEGYLIEMDYAVRSENGIGCRGSFTLRKTLVGTTSVARANITD